MLSTARPTPFPIPFAAHAGPSYIRSIPAASQVGVTPGAASLYDGFPPLNFLPTPVVGGTGVPPFGQDMNGILNEATAATQWLQAGGTPSYDSTFCTAIGGYPAGAILANVGRNGFWTSLVDNNTVNPDSGPSAYWVSFAGPGEGLQYKNTVVITSTAAANAYLLALSTSGSNIVTNTIFIFNGASPITLDFTLHNATFIDGEILEYYNYGAGLVTVDINGGSGWVRNGNISGYNWVLEQGDTATVLYSTAATFFLLTWMIIGGSIALVGAPDFLGNLNISTQQAYQLFPSGAIMQYGTVAANATPGSPSLATFPIAFPNGTLLVIPSCNAGVAATAWVGTYTNSNVNLYSTSGAGYINYYALGY
jgi:hypothetical protein